MADIPAKVLQEAADLADRRVRIAEAFSSNNAALNLEQLRADLQGDGPSLAEMIMKRFEASWSRRRNGFAHRSR